MLNLILLSGSQRTWTNIPFKDNRYIAETVVSSSTTWPSGRLSAAAMEPFRKHLQLPDQASTALCSGSLEEGWAWRRGTGSQAWFSTNERGEMVDKPSFLAPPWDPKSCFIRSHRRFPMAPRINFSIYPPFFGNIPFPVFTPIWFLPGIISQINSLYPNPCFCSAFGETQNKAHHQNRVSYILNCFIYWKIHEFKVYWGQESRANEWLQPGGRIQRGMEMWWTAEHRLCVKRAVATYSQSICCAEMWIYW